MARKTDSILNKNEDIVVCLPGASIDHVTQLKRRPSHGPRRGNGGSTLVHVSGRAMQIL